ncbi:MAG: hypothetical protein KBD56_09530 [Candidatus Eisenbacteria bacterium]|nr:hypothetical protein [Candidatus Eisenbacteria bacterium]
MSAFKKMVLVVAMLAFPAAVLAMTPYSQDFEGMDPAYAGALADDGWLVYGNVFGPDWAYWYGYGPYPAPNGGNGFSAVVTGQGGMEQGANQLSVYNDYNNADHANGAHIEANVYREQVVAAEDIGLTWYFEFEAKRGNIEGATTALAFIKTLDPNSGYTMTNFITADMTSIPDTWGAFTLEILIDADLVGQILQIGFASTATAYEGSGIFYDNINFSAEPPTPTESSSWGEVKSLYR